MKEAETSDYLDTTADSTEAFTPGGEEENDDAEYEEEEEDEDLRPLFAKRATMLYAEGDRWQVSGLDTLTKRKLIRRGSCWQ